MSSQTKITFEKGKELANEMELILKNLHNYLNDLQNIVDNLSWQGNNADNFKRKTHEIKDSWDIVYKNSLVPIPNTVRVRIDNYQQYENN